MKYLIFLLFICPLSLLGQKPDTICICSKQVPKVGSSKMVTEMAEYPGGYKALKHFIRTNLSMDSSENGKIQTHFVISCKGRTCAFGVSNSEGLSRTTEDKIIEVLMRMNNWKPAMQNTQAVDILFTISFSIYNGILKFEDILKD